MFSIPFKRFGFCLQSVVTKTSDGANTDDLHVGKDEEDDNDDEDEEKVAAAHNYDPERLKAFNVSPGVTSWHCAVVWCQRFNEYFVCWQMIDRDYDSILQQQEIHKYVYRDTCMYFLLKRPVLC